VTPFAALVIVGVFWRAVPPRRRPPVVVTAAVFVGFGPLWAILAVVMWGGSAAMRRRSVDREDVRAAGLEVVDLARFLLVGVGAGWSLDASLRHARAHLVTSLGAEVGEILRGGRVDGLAASLASADGAGAALFHMLARTHLGGVPLDRSLATFIREAVDRRRGEITERARRLPVRMVVPLTLLMLPGFVLLVAGPAVLISARQLLAPFVT